MRAEIREFSITMITYFAFIMNVIFKGRSKLEWVIEDVIPKIISGAWNLMRL